MGFFRWKNSQETESMRNVFHFDFRVSNVSSEEARESSTQMEGLNKPELNVPITDKSEWSFQLLAEKSHQILKPETPAFPAKPRGVEIVSLGFQ